jgi:predicted dehydrogenase
VCEADSHALLVRPDIDAVVISTPHHCHIDEALLAAEHGKHALVEKPLTTSVADCDRLIDAFTDRQLTLAVGYHQRFRESNRRVRDLVQSGAIGQVRAIQMSALFDIEELRQDEGFGGGWDWWKDPRSIAHLMNSAPHNVDLCRWWLQSEIHHLAASSGTYREENPNENTTMALLVFNCGTTATFWSSSVCPSPGFPGEDFRFRIMGDSGLIDANPFGEIQLGRRGDWELVYEQPRVAFDDSQAAFTSDGRMQAYCDQMQAWVDRIEGRESEAGDAQDGRAGVAAVVGMLEASASQEVVQLERPSVTNRSSDG